MSVFKKYIPTLASDLQHAIHSRKEWESGELNLQKTY